MEPTNDDAPLIPRLPTSEDFLNVCRLLNGAGAKYIVVGGWAIIQQGFGRTTEDIDILIESTSDNFLRVKSALSALPDGAARELRDDDFRECLVVRVADEIIVDVMMKACGLDYQEAASDIEWREIQTVRIPFANARLLWRTKQTYREKDALDRQYLASLLAAHRNEPS